MDLASVDEVLSTTRSVRRRLDFDRPVEPQVIKDCIALATQAPTGAPGEAWRFVIITEPDKRAAIARLYNEVLTEYAAVRGPLKQTQHALARRMHEFPVLILVCAVGQPDPSSLAQQVAFYGSVLPAAWSLMLALRARKLGCTWTTLLSRQADEVAKVLDIPENVTQTIMLPVAYTLDAVLKPAQRLRPEEVTYWNTWGELE